MPNIIKECPSGSICMQIKPGFVSVLLGAVLALLGVVMTLETIRAVHLG
jgi:hypothetical protein